MTVASFGRRSLRRPHGRSVDGVTVFGVLVVLIGGMLAVGAIVQRRDYVRGRVGREVGGIQRESRDQRRDMRAVKRVHNLYNPDLSSTEWGRRERRSR